eukprot:4803435-Pyramimonas_sp.AAC.1
MGMCVHTADRVLILGREASGYITVERSILQGCIQSVNWTRAYVHDMLDHAHARYRHESQHVGGRHISLLEGPQGYRAQADHPGCHGLGVPDECPRSPSLRKVPAPR